ncbi:MAG: cell division protein FtsZ [Bacteroidaceae bacterium]|nr:cell division protein FtsZ [Bacteroidaceae bacterium]MBQ8675529.1 cell division protein FtsZ [Bacteroidaceae bacterium]MBQ9175578.1 cell division protein FtsZ [Bacteroidaceae bacterium]MBR1378255.1 cell division protein FtsZ [Bacteroidaceae bacterium]
MDVEFTFPQEETSIIKVIGVGGGGCNAVNNMYSKGIHDVSFIVCNTDNKALNDSVVPSKLQLGKDGLGAGNNPAAGKQAAEESLDDIKKVLNDGTKMVFITAGMGGGTGTGAAPVIAKTAKEMDILTVGIVTIPFRWEGIKKIDQALDGVEEMSKNVDALLVINNERLREIYPELTVLDAFSKADETLCNAARSIAEIITMHGIINLDFKDVKTVLLNGGVAIMSTGYGSGDLRISKAIEDALHSPLLNNNDIYNSKKLLLHIAFCGDESQGAPSLMMEEMNEIHEFMAKMQTADIIETKWGLSVDHSLGEKVKVTILATGFGVGDINSTDMTNRINKRNEEERKRAAERTEKEIERERRRINVYGPTDSSSSIRKLVYTYAFKDEDLDNDDVISMVESIPTYKRKREDLRNIDERSNSIAAAAPAAGSVISFS